MKANKNIARGFAATALLFTLAGCGKSTDTSDKINFNPKDIKYDIDPKTGFCFASVASISSGWLDWNTNGLGMTCVPCTAEALKEVNQSHLEEAKKNGVVPYVFK